MNVYALQVAQTEIARLRAELDEAVALLRTLSDRDNYEPYFLAIVDAFLSRLDAGKVQS